MAGATNPQVVNNALQARGDSNKAGYFLRDAGRNVLLRREDLEKCSFEIATVDTRPNSDPKNADVEGFMKNYADNFMTLGALANQAYAEKHGYRFRKIEPRKNDAYGDAWNRVFYAAERLEELAKGPDPCAWLVYMDFDAFVRQPDTSMSDFMTSLAQKYHINKEQSFIIAKQFEGPDINGGVWMVRADENGRSVLNTWVRLFNSLPDTDESLRNRWPLEQGGLNSILLTERQRHSKDQSEDVVPDEYILQLGHKDVEQAQKTTVMVDLEEMNSHNGRFIEHVWNGARDSGPGSLDGFDHRVDPGIAAAAVHIGDPARFANLMHNLKTNTVSDWVPTVIAK